MIRLEDKMVLFPNKAPLKVLYFWDSEINQYVVICLDIDIVSQGETIPNAREMLFDAMKMIIDDHVKRIADGKIVRNKIFEKTPWNCIEWKWWNRAKPLGFIPNALPDDSMVKAGWEPVYFTKWVAEERIYS